MKRLADLLILLVMLGLFACDGVTNRVDDHTTVRCGFGADVMTDIEHCGACDNVCAFEHAEPACVAGSCVLAGCAPDFVDLDDDPGNGCECRVEDERCNAVDDDCDGEVDEAQVCALDCMIDAGLTCAEGVLDGRPDVLYTCLDGHVSEQVACLHGCRDGACLGPPLTPGRIVSPGVGMILPVGPIEVRWTPGESRDGEAIESTVACGSSAESTRQAAAYGAEQAEIAPLAPGSRLICRVQTRLVARPDQVASSEAVEWAIDPAVAAPEIIDVVVEDQANACGRVRVSLQVANRGDLIGRWTATVAVISLEDGGVAGDAELYGPPTFRVAPQSAQSFNIDVDLVAPAPPGEPTTGLRVTLEDAEFGFHPPLERVIALPAVDTGPPRVLRWNRIGPAVIDDPEGGAPTVLPGQEVADQIALEDDYGIAWAEVSWAVEGDAWQPDVPLEVEPRGACLDELTFELAWTVPAGYPAGTPAQLRLVAEDLAGNRLEALRPMRLGQVEQVTAAFERPIADEPFEVDARGRRCIPVRIRVDPGPGIAYSGIGLSNALLQEVRGEVPVGVIDGVIETCLEASEVGDDLRVVLHVQDANGQHAPLFASLPLAIPFEPSAPPWGRWQVVPTERPLDQLPGSAAPSLQFRRPRLTEAGFDVLRFDARDNRGRMQAQVRDLSIDPAAARRGAARALLDLTTQLEAEERIPVTALGPLAPALRTVAATREVEGDCADGPCLTLVAQTAAGGALEPVEAVFDFPDDGSRSIELLELPDGLMLVESERGAAPPRAAVYARRPAGWMALGQIRSRGELLAADGEALIAIEWDDALEAYVAHAFDGQTLETRGSTPLITPGPDRTRVLLSGNDGGLAFIVLDASRLTVQRARLMDNGWIVEPIVPLPPLWRSAPIVAPRLMAATHSALGTLLRIRFTQADETITIDALLSADGVLDFDGAWLPDDDTVGQLVEHLHLGDDGTLLEAEACRWNLIPRLCWRMGAVDARCASPDPCVDAHWDDLALDCRLIRRCEE